MSESILLLNPRRARRRNKRRRGGRMPAALKAYWAARRATNPRKRRRRRRHARGAAYRATNPRRHHRRHHRRTNRRRLHARRRHNPRRLRASGARSMRFGRGVVGEYVIPAAIGGGGALVLDVIWGYLSPKLPTQVQTGWFALGAKLGVVLGAAYLANRFVPRFRSKTHTAAVGAATVLAYGAIKGVAQSVLPTSVPGLSGYIDYQSYALPGARMGGYMPRGVGAGLGDLSDFFSPAAVIQPAGMSVPQQFGGLRGYIAQPMGGYITAQPHMGGGGGLMGYDWQNDGM